MYYVANVGTANSTHTGKEVVDGEFARCCAHSATYHGLCVPPVSRSDHRFRSQIKDKLG